MTGVYYNEFDSQAAAWLRELIKDGYLPEGDVDERSIKDVAPDDVRGYRACHWFAGIGGWPYAWRLAGLPDDFGGWTGSCPCQPYSSAGKQEGDNDPRNLWPELFRLIRECRPECVFGEQVEGAIRHGWLDRVCADLEGEGYAVGAVVLGAHSAGSPHIRQRLYWVAHLPRDGREQGWRAIGERAGPGVDGGAGELGHLTSDGRPEHERRPGAGEEPNATDAGRELGRVGDADCPGPQSRGRTCEADGYGRAAVADGGAGVALGDACAPGLPHSEPEELRGAGRRVEGRAVGEPSGSFWSDYDLVSCRDGKARRVEPGSFPLAHGVPRELGPLVAVLERMGVDPKSAKRTVRNFRGCLAKAGRNRVGRLRGYGNALVPQVAAAFIWAFLEAEIGMT